jgi:hypothetical protein
MIATTFASLLLLLFSKYLPTGNYPLIIADLLLLALSFGVAAKAVQLFLKVRKGALFDVRLRDRHEEDFLADELHVG